jgi:LDH2 family malate/lactate/ureidoglycolate dehydrogenase
MEGERMKNGIPLVNDVVKDLTELADKFALKL